MSVSSRSVNVTEPRPLLIAGASARAALQSALRSGLIRVRVADMFGDQDLAGAMCVHRLESNYQNLPALAREVDPASEWMYLGALENHPQLVAEVPLRLLGNDATVLRRVRDPWQVHSALSAAGLYTPALVTDASDLPRDGTWLSKPYDSAAGLGIHIVDAQLDASTSSKRLPTTPIVTASAATRRRYFQAKVNGDPYSAIYLAANGECRLLGVTRQLLLTPGLAQISFQYAGSIGPLPLAESCRTEWQRIGDCLSRCFSLNGIFGVDAIDDGQRLWPVEVNPRYTASCEILERFCGTSLVAWHCQACRSGSLPNLNGNLGANTPPPRTIPAFHEQLAATRSGPAQTTHLVGKRIVFATRDLVVSESFLRWVTDVNRNQSWPRVADIPTLGSSVAQGHPIVTVFVDHDGPSPTTTLLSDTGPRAANVEQVQTELSQWEDRVLSQLNG